MGGGGERWSTISISENVDDEGVGDDDDDGDDGESTCTYVCKYARTFVIIIIIIIINNSSTIDIVTDADGV